MFFYKEGHRYSQDVHIIFEFITNCLKSRNTITDTQVNLSEAKRLVKERLCLPMDVLIKENGRMMRYL